MGGEEEKLRKKQREAALLAGEVALDPVLPYGLEEDQLAPSALDTLQKNEKDAAELQLRKKKPKNEYELRVAAAAAKKEARAAEEKAAMGKLIQDIETESNGGRYAPKAFVKGGTEGVTAEGDDHSEGRGWLKGEARDGGGTGVGSVYIPVPKTGPLVQQTFQRLEKQTSTGAGGKRKRAIDEIREEMAGLQSERKRAKYEGSMYGRGNEEREMDDSANILVSNAPLNITEALLFEKFSVYGSIVSIKVMRTRGHVTRNRSSAFVAFAMRQEAEKAMEKLNGTNFYGERVHLVWGKAVRMDGEPLKFVPFAPPGDHTVEEHCRNQTRRKPLPSHLLKNIFVYVPVNEKWCQIVTDLAKKMHTENLQVAQIFASRALDPEYSWLKDNKSQRLRFLKWKVRSLRRGESDDRWDPTPYLEEEGGFFWVPPTLKADLDESLEKQKRAAKNKQKNANIEAYMPLPVRRLMVPLLNNLTTERQSIMMAMGAALDNVEGAGGICEAIGNRVLATKASVSRQVALLYLVSDILSNSSAVKNGSAFLRAFQPILPDVFTALNASLQGITGRISRSNLKQKVVRVLAAWKTWSVYPAVFLNGLEATFLMDKNNTIIGKDLDPDAALVFDTSSSSLPSQESLKEMNVEALRKVCVTQGFSGQGSRDELIARLEKAHEYVRLRQEEEKPNVTAAVLEEEYARFEKMLSQLVGTRCNNKPPVTKEVTKIVTHSNEADSRKEEAAGLADDEADFIPFDADDEDDEDEEEDEEEDDVEEDVDEDVDGVPLSTVADEPVPEDMDVDGLPLEGDIDGLAEDNDIDMDGRPLDNVDGEPLNDDVDGVSLDADIDGEPMDVDLDGQSLCDAEEDVDGEPLDQNIEGKFLPEAEDIDGEPLDEDVDGEPLEDEAMDEDVDGVPLDVNCDEGFTLDDVDGVPMDADDVDGAPLEDVDGVPLADDVDGVPLDEQDVDGVPLGDEDLNGAALDGEDLDGIPL